MIPLSMTVSHKNFVKYIACRCRMEEKLEFLSGSMDEKVQNGGKA